MLADAREIRGNVRCRRARLKLPCREGSAALRAVMKGRNLFSKFRLKNKLPKFCNHFHWPCLGYAWLRYVEENGRLHSHAAKREMFFVRYLGK